MTPSLCVLMADYNRWMNQRLYEAAARLPEEQVRLDRGAFFGSLFETLNHIAVADLLWLHRFAQLQNLGTVAAAMKAHAVPTTLTQRLAPSLRELGALRAEVDEVIVQLASSVDEHDLEATLQYSNVSGKTQAKKFGLLLQHFFNHQTHHRGQASTLLFQAGIDIGVTDLNALIPSEV